MQEEEADDVEDVEHRFSEEVDPAAAARNVDSLVRNGHLVDAAVCAAAIEPLASGPLEPVLTRLDGDGFVEEVAVIRLLRSHRSLYELLVRAESTGRLAGIVAFVALLWPAIAYSAWPALMFGVVPAMAARILASEVHLRLVDREVMESLGPADRPRARLLFDLSIYRASGVRPLTRADAWMLVVGGAVSYAVAFWLAWTSVGALAVWTFAITGAVMIVAGIGAVAGTRRVVLSSVLLRVVETGTAPKADATPVTPITESVTFAWPRMGRSLSACPVLCFAALMVKDDGLGPTLVAALLLGCAATVGARGFRTKVVVSDSGIVDIGVVRTRSWTWNQVHEVRSGHSWIGDPDQSMKVVDDRGTERLLVVDAGRSDVNPRLITLFGSMNAAALAPTPGPSRRSRGVRTVTIAVLACLLGLFSWWGVTAIAGPTSKSIAAADVPAGRSYTYYRQPDGRRGHATIECPSLIGWVGGERDPLCDGAERSRAMGLAVLLVIGCALLGGLVAAVRVATGAHRTTRTSLEGSRRGSAADVLYHGPLIELLPNEFHNMNVSHTFIRERGTMRSLRLTNWMKTASPAVLPLALTAALLLAVMGLAPGPVEALPCSGVDCGDGGPGDGGGGDGGGGGGGGGGTVFTTPVVYVADRTDTTITVGWFVSDAASSYRLEHFDGTGWSTVHTSTQVDEAPLVHGPLDRDTRHCYRIVARAISSTKTSDSACAYTKDGLILRSIWRVQLRITTGDVPGGDTDNDIRVGVGGPVNGKTGGGTWLDHAGDDFERGNTRSYDLVNLVGITDLGDIESLELYKSGTDDWCLQNVTLLVNDSAVFSTGFGSPCQWVTQSAPLVQISHEALHDYPLWGKRTPTSGPISGYRIPYETILNGNNATLVIGHEQLEGRIESQVGDSMYGKSAYWAPPDAVELTRWDSQRSKVDLDLKGEATGGDPDIDVDFDMVVGTHKDNAGNWFVDISVDNANATISPSWYHYLFVAMSAGTELSAPERQIERSFAGIAEQVGIGKIYDLKASFDNNANLVIVATLQCPQTDPIRNTCLVGNHWHELQQAA